MSVRNFVDFEGIGLETATFKIDNTIVYDSTEAGGCAAIGRAVTVTGNGTVGLAADGDRIRGKLLDVTDDGFCTVQIEGGATLPGGNGATLTPGSKIVGALDAGAHRGFIRSIAATAAGYVQGTETDIAKGDHEIVDATTSTAVQVLLG